MSGRTAGAPELWVVRHGETEWSRSGRHTSTTDLALTEEGVRVAEGLRARLAGVGFDRVLTSPRRRARQTAELAGYAAADVVEDLAEWVYGEFEGVTTAEIQQRVPDWSIWTDPVPGGESAEEIATRLDRVVGLARDGGRTLVFSHGHALRVLAARWLRQPVAAGRMFYLDTATVGVLGDDRGEPVVRRWNA